MNEKNPKILLHVYILNKIKNAGKMLPDVAGILVYQANSETLGFGSYRKARLVPFRLKKVIVVSLFAKSHHHPACHGILGILKNGPTNNSGRGLLLMSRGYRK